MCRSCRRLPFAGLAAPAQAAERVEQAATGLGNLAEAIAELKVARDMNPKNEQINYNLAVNYAKTGDFKNSLATLTDAIKKQPRLKMNAADEAAFDKMKNMAEFKKLLQK